MINFVNFLKVHGVSYWDREKRVSPPPPPPPHHAHKEQPTPTLYSGMISIIYKLFLEWSFIHLYDFLYKTWFVFTKSEGPIVLSEFLYYT